MLCKNIPKYLDVHAMVNFIAEIQLKIIFFKDRTNLKVTKRPVKSTQLSLLRTHPYRKTFLKLSIQTLTNE